MSVYYREMISNSGIRPEGRPRNFDHRVDLRPASLPFLMMPTLERDWDDHLKFLRENNPALFSDDRRTRLQAEKELRQAQAIEGAHFVDALYGQGTRYEIKHAMEEELMPRAERVEVERALADYILDVAASHPLENVLDNLTGLAYSLRFCHHSGCLGLRPGGERVIAWDHKCEKVRLCPHESREETQRIAEIYIPAIREELERDPALRIYYAVANPRHVPEGKLKEGKQKLFARTRDWLRDERVACPLVWNDNKNAWHHTKPFSMATAVQGALVVQEDPRSLNGNWNVHQNCLLIVKGQFPYALAWQMWGEKEHVNFQEIKKDDLMGAVLEIVKYSTRTVPEKSQGKAAKYESKAPAMTEWPHAAWLEWWAAQQGFRRTRSYGVIYAVERRRWNACTAQERFDKFFRQAQLRGHDLPVDYVYQDWCSLPEKDRAILRDVMRKPEIFSLDDVLWCGRVDYMDELRGYWIDLSAPYLNKWVALLPGDNFSNFPVKNNFETGPPPDAWRECQRVH
jgi:hypothetical protein